MKLIECPVSAEQAVATIRDDQGYRLEFARQRAGGRVHVLRPWAEDGMGAGQLRTSGLYIAAGSIYGWSLCGIRLVLNPQRGYRVARFADEDLCAKCHEILRDQAVRCFEHDRPPEL